MVHIRYGSFGTPTSRAQVEEQFDAMRPRLEPSAIVLEFLDIMQRTAIFPWPLASLQWMLVRAAVALVPARIRDLLELDGRFALGELEHPIVCLLGRIADGIAIPSSPAVQACRRLGLPADHLYRGTLRS